MSYFVIITFFCVSIELGTCGYYILHFKTLIEIMPKWFQYSDEVLFSFSMQKPLFEITTISPVSTLLFGSHSNLLETYREDAHLLDMQVWLSFCLFYSCFYFHSNFQYWSVRVLVLVFLIYGNINNVMQPESNSKANCLEIEYRRICILSNRIAIYVNEW